MECAGERLTGDFETREKPSEDVLAGVRHGHRAELRHHDAVSLGVEHVGVTAQEAAAVGDLAVADVEAMHHGHAVEPVVVAEDTRQ